MFLLIAQVAPVEAVPTGSVVVEVMEAVWTVFGAGFLTLAGYALQRAAAKFGVEITDAQLASLKAHVVHAVNLLAPIAAQQLVGKGQVAIRNRTAELVVGYIATHHDELAKAVGIDAATASGAERLHAQVASAIDDPMIPTPDVLGGRNVGPTLAPPERI